MGVYLGIAPSISYLEDDVTLEDNVPNQRQTGSAGKPLQHLHMSPTRLQLLIAAQKFCESFAEKKSIDEILAHFSTTHEISVIEYGAPILAPFLGRPFVGSQAVKQYFDLISSLLSYKEMAFSEYVVDTEVLKASVKGRAEFTWLNTCQSWNETFTYTLDFDEEAKITRYQVWADSGSAYLASHGRLNKPET
ncbi:hypothetical protein JR316_0004587 [Psilocybe cubensis]|uniref:Uncharacterized protein n=2 Tax=Psilocybe cubensis TaxID=181762 RepID=A0A8H7XY47_PSICU|nr:hypothetical protein JR316_0004587 [Psilocybe cubensis]KAH9482487.1 hypothetical protein JR316_0004587 [Psilocybe cubensis]